MALKPNNEDLADPAGITYWLSGMRRGDPEAQQAILARVFKTLERAAKRRLPKGKISSEADDIAIQTLKTAFRRAQAGEFWQLENASDLWKVLEAIAARKRLRVVRDALRKKRDVRRNESGAALEKLENRQGERAEYFVELIDLLNDLPKVLGKENDYLTIARLRLEGYSIAEIAEALDVSYATISRKMKIIHSILNKYRDG
jgi:DNA-directed RNA polymerase specialized sigma24 family protein